MMEDVAPVVGGLGLLALIAGAVMFLPIEALRRRRSVAKMLAIGGGIAFVVGLIFSPTPPASTEASVVATATPGTTAVPTPTASATPSEIIGAAAKDAFISRYREMLAAAKICDDASTLLGKAANGGSQLATYQAARNGRDACRTAATTIGGLEAPDNLSDAGSEAFEKATDTCRNAYIYRQMGMEKAIEIADGDNRPSVITEMQDNMKTGQDGTMLCVAAWFDAAAKSGIDVKALK